MNKELPLRVIFMYFYGRWVAYVAHKYIGTFKTKDEAAKSHYDGFALNDSKLKGESNV